MATRLDPDVDALLAREANLQLVFYARAAARAADRAGDGPQVLEALVLLACALRAVGREAAADEAAARAAEVAELVGTTVPPPLEGPSRPARAAARLAADVLAAPVPEAGAARDLLRTVGPCEGLRSGLDEVVRALRRALDAPEVAATLTPVERAAAERWLGRFGPRADPAADAGGPRLAACDFRTCEARCCHDGAHLAAGEEERIAAVVAAHPDRFAHVPEAWTVRGRGGVKTATRPHAYTAPDFPPHFPRTRCVMALEDGACALQALALDEGIDPWTHKPLACRLHPVRVAARRALPPPGPDDPDPLFHDAEYPGFVAFSPCGQHRADGAPWHEVLAAEVAAAERLAGR